MRAASFLGLAGWLLLTGCEASTSAPVASPSPQLGSDAALPASAPATPVVAEGNAAANAAASAIPYAPPAAQNPASPPQASPPSASASPPSVSASSPSLPSGQSPAGQAPPGGQTPVYEKAEAGVGVRGDRIEGGGIISTPARAFFQVRERTAFLQVEQALNLFRGLEGRLPGSHEEFMQKVIQANGIRLPELAPGSRYLWDAEKGELMVERPR